MNDKTQARKNRFNRAFGNNPIVCIRCKVKWSFSHGAYMPHGTCCEDRGRACIFDDPEIP